MIFVLSVLNRVYNFARVCFICNLVNRVFRERFIFIFCFQNFLCTSSIQKKLPINDFKSRRHTEAVFCNKIEGCSRPKQRFNILYVCLLVCLFVCFLFYGGSGSQAKHWSSITRPPNPSPTLPYTPRVEVVHPLVKFNPAWVPHFLLTNRKDNKQESTT